MLSFCQWLLFGQYINHMVYLTGSSAWFVNCLAHHCSNTLILRDILPLHKSVTSSSKPLNAIDHLLCKILFFVVFVVFLWQISIDLKEAQIGNILLHSRPCCRSYSLVKHLLPQIFDDIMKIDHRTINMLCFEWI